MVRLVVQDREAPRWKVTRHRQYDKGRADFDGPLFCLDALNQNTNNTSLPCDGQRSIRPAAARCLAVEAVLSCVRRVAASSITFEGMHVND